MRRYGLTGHVVQRRSSLSVRRLSLVDVDRLFFLGLGLWRHELIDFVPPRYSYAFPSELSPY